jgi:hypothetical protein
VQALAGDLAAIERRRGGSAPAVEAALSASPARRSVVGRKNVVSGVVKAAR